jgi:Zn-dependent peptidase ImmA (M78 family)/DNA-binding XRE family transcriptional regulator
LNHADHLARKLKQARMATGQSTRKVASRLPDRVKVSHSTLANYEAGRSKPTMDVLSVLAALYDRPLNWFLTESLSMRNVRYRNRKSRVRQNELARYEANAVKWLQAYEALERTLRAPMDKDQTLAAFRFTPGESGAAAAGRFREELKLDEEDAVPSVAELLERLGVRAIELPTSLAIDGLAALGKDEYVVVLNSTVSSDRARLNAAHEVAHVLAGDCDDDIDNDGPAERRAFDFASHLLLTEEMLREAFRQKSMVRLVQFKERYGISVAAMIYRAAQSGLISEALSKRIWIEISRRGWRQNEPGHVAEDRVIRFERLLDAALLEERLTLEQAAELTGVRADELRERREWALGLVAWHDHARVQNHDQEQPFLRLVE